MPPPAPRPAGPPGPAAPTRANLLISRAIAIVLVLLAAAIVVFGIQLVRNRAASDRTGAAGSTLATQCPDVDASVVAAARRVPLMGADGRALGAAIVGDPSATLGVVLRHGASQTICDWLPWAVETARANQAQVLLFDRRGKGSSPGEPGVTKEPSDTQAAVAVLAAQGADKVALVASSMGNSVMYAALPGLTPPPCAVVSISPVLTSSDDSGTVQGDRLTDLTDNTWITWESRAPGIVAEVGAIQRALSVQGRTAPHELAVDTKDHSRALIAKHPEAAAFVQQAIASCR